MNVIVSVGGRFHSFNLASQLERHNALGRLITSYPAYLVKPYGVPVSKVSSIILKEVFDRILRKLVPSAVPRFQFASSEFFDRFAARHLKPADIFVGWSSFSLHALRQAKQIGCLTVLEHGSSYVLYQTEILKEEYEKYGLRPVTASPKIIEKELQEYAEADYISIPSLFVKRTFLERGIPESKLIHVPFGVDLSSFRQIEKKDDVFRVIFAGGMTLRKGLHYLLQAFVELRLPNSELMLLGSINEEIRPFFKKYTGHFRHVGHVPQAELYKYYSQGSVFVLPSIEEGLAMVQPQAMACGLPVIATTNTGGEDIIRNGVDGFIIPIRDINALKEKIFYLYEHPEERARMGASAKARVAQGFTWDDYGNKMVREYERILAK